MSEDNDALSALLARPDLSQLLAVLDGDGEETRVVGGAVRNALLDRPTHDIDLATTAVPPVVVARARAAGLHVVPTGIAHGTVTVLVAGVPFEVTTLRRDVETDGRHAVVAFGRSFDDDARRRDFTMNALSLSADGTLHDPVRGLPDLRARRVRFIGDARQRIAEDYLRILRLFRFHAAYGDGPLDPSARDAAIAGRGGLARLSAERLKDEIGKLLVAARASEVVAEMADCGLLGAIVGGVVMPGRFARACAITDAAGLPRDPVRSLAALAIFTREDVVRLRERLRLSNAATKRLDDTAGILESHHAPNAPARDIVEALLFQCKTRVPVNDALIVLHAQARDPVDDAHWHTAHAQALHSPVPRFPVTGDDLLRHGVPPGRSVGAALKTLQARWIRAGFPRDPAALARLVEDVARGGDQ